MDPSARAPLTLDGDGATNAPDIASWLEQWADADQSRVALAGIVLAIADAAIPLADRLALGAIPGDPNTIVGTNDSGDAQKALDVAAHDHLMQALRGASVHTVLSEEAEDVIELNPNGLFDVAIDPIDGSGSIGIGAPLGLLFAAFPGGGGFLRSGRGILAAGYVSFGHSIDLAFSVGTGVVVATYDRRSGKFHVAETDVTLPAKTASIAYNASNARHWSGGLQRYIGDCIAGTDGPRGRNFNMRWLAAAVGELHRIVRRGGLFLYPADRRAGYENGRLRLIYEAFPIAWLIEQAGGAATDGTAEILDRIPRGLHENTPLIFGCKEEVAHLMRTLNDTPN